MLRPASTLTDSNIETEQTSRADEIRQTMAIAVEKKAKLITDYRRHEGDTGSPEVQIAMLTERIVQLTDHLRTHRHDYASRRGLLMMVGKRSRLLRYLVRVDRPAYQALIKRLGLRK